MKATSMLLGSVFSLACVITLSADDKMAWREKLETAIPEAIRMLEAKEYAIFLKAFVEPKQLKKMAEQGPMEDAVKKFANSNAKQLLRVLKWIKDTTPKMNKEGTSARYEFNLDGVSRTDITFNKIDKYWYIGS